MIKKAMIMAAGVGSRLEPLSSIIPKPLVPVANIPVMDILINHLGTFGIKDIISNTYYKSEEIQNHYNEKNIRISFIKEENLSGTAGGVKKCQYFFNENEDFIVMSGDGLTDIDIKKAYKSHEKSGSIATIIIKEVAPEETEKYGIVVADENGYIKSFQEKPNKREANSNLANTGIYIFNYEIFKYIPENTFYDFAKNVFPTLLKNNIKINTYKMSEYWSDIGSLSSYHQSNVDILNQKVLCCRPQTISGYNYKYITGNNTILDTTVSMEGVCVIGNNCRIGRNAKIINSIIWNNVKISDNVVIENSIILSGTNIEESVRRQIVKEDKLKEHTYITV